MSENNLHRLRARWVIPIDRPPLRDGVVEIRGGVIENVRAYQPSESVIDLGDVALLPALVNTHTHLEFSELESPLASETTSFPDWIREVVQYRREREERATPAQWRSAGVRRGLIESLSANVCAIGEIATSPIAEEQYCQMATDTTVFLELLGLASERVEQQWASAVAFADGAKEASFRRGLCPHAPYTVHPELFSRACQLATERQMPIAFHLAESLAEVELLQSGSGRLVEVLESLGASPRLAIPRGSCPQDYLTQLASTPRSLVIHGNYLSANEIAYVGERSDRMSMVYCPRTHRRFNPGNYPLAEMLTANVNVCLGTDSRATNPDLDLWKELQFVAQHHPQVTGEGILHMGTLAGAEALGINGWYGSLTSGKAAQMISVTLSGESDADLYDAVLAGQPQVVRVSNPLWPSRSAR